MFLRDKQDNGYRVFILGGSTSAGYPWEYNFSFSNILKEHLITYKPRNHVEMVNLSMPALNSYAVLDIFKQLLSHKPDLVIIYTCLLYTSPSPRDRTRSRMPSSA